MNDLPVVTWFGYKTLAIYRFITGRFERSSRIFSASSANSWQHKMIQTWIRLYLEKGKDYFICDALKQKKKLINKIAPTQISEHINLVTPRKPKHPKVDESLLPDEIRNELNKLRMENEYLKKLNALVRKKEKSQTRIKLK